MLTAPWIRVASTLGGWGWHFAKLISVLVIHWGAHDVSSEDSKYQTLLWFGVDVCPHLLGGTVFDNDLAVVDLILDKKYFTLIFLVCFELLALPFVSRSIVHTLS
jgi:hypothetical protein